MAIFAGPTLIEAPPVPPRPYGLFDVALGPMSFPRPEAQGGGVRYVPDACEDDVYLYAMSCPPVSGMKTFTSVEAAVSGEPFAVVTSYTCGSLGFSFTEAEQRVRTRMMLREQRAVERRVWQGQVSAGLGIIPGLLRGATNIGPAGCVTEAVELLEQALADNGVVGGMIHARPGMSPHLSNNFLVREKGRQITTPLGTPYVFGQGYDGTGPAGEAVTTDVEYMYASGRVLIWQSDVWVSPPGQVLNRATNQLSLLGERIYAALIECGTWTVAVTRNCTTAGSV